MKTYANQIWNYKFQDAKKSLWAIPLYHGIVATFFLMSFYFGPRSVFNLIVFLFFLAAIKMIDLSNLKNISILFFSYLILLIIEVVVLGIPESLLKIQDNSAVGKGIFLDIFFYTLPWIYIGVKFFLLLLFLPLIQVLKAKQGER